MRLLDAFKSPALSLKNRIVMAPMTRQRAADDHTPTPMMVEYYRQRATAGLLITEGTPIAPEGVGYSNVPGIYTDAHIDGWRDVTTAVHSAGGKIALQLWHVGRSSHTLFQPEGQLPIAPSAIAISPDITCYTPEGPTQFETPRAMTLEDISRVKDEFVTAAHNAKAAGFDAVEIHAANGYLLDQFLRDGSNKRDDNYGGSIANRSRFTLDITEAVCAEVGSDYTGIRVSPINTFNDMSDSDPNALFNYLAGELNAFDLAFLHVAEGVIGDPSLAPAFDYSALRQTYKGVYMANGDYSKESGELALSEGKADLIAIGRPFIANPDLVARYIGNAELNEVDYDTCYGGNEKGYIDYPAMA